MEVRYVFAGAGTVSGCRRVGKRPGTGKVVIPGPAEGPSPESIIPAVALERERCDAARFVVIDSGLTLRAPRNDGEGSRTLRAGVRSN